MIRSQVAFALLWIYVFLMPWEKSLVIPGLGTMAKGAAAAAVLGWLVSRPKAVGPAPLVTAGAGALFVAWSALSWFWSAAPDATLARAVTFVGLLAISVATWFQAHTPERQRALLAAYVAGAAVASLFTVYRYSANLQTYWRRFAAPGFDPNDLAITVAIAIPMALYLARGWPGAVLACIAVLLAASRTALIATYVALAAGLWTRRWVAAGLLVAVTAGVFALAPPAARERLATTAKEIRTGTLHKRTVIWKAGVRAFRQRPLIGAGSGAYPAAVKPFIGVPPVPGHEYVAHNSFLSVLAETGVVGFAFYALMLAAAAGYAWALHGRERTLWLTVFAVWAIGASTLTWEHRKPSWFLVSMIASTWSRAYLRSHEERPS